MTDAQTIRSRMPNDTGTKYTVEVHELYNSILTSCAAASKEGNVWVRIKEWRGNHSDETRKAVLDRVRIEGFGVRDNTAFGLSVLEEEDKLGIKTYIKDTIVLDWEYYCPIRCHAQNVQMLNLSLVRDQAEIKAYQLYVRIANECIAMAARGKDSYVVAITSLILEDKGMPLALVIPAQQLLLDMLEQQDFGTDYQQQEPNCTVCISW